MRTILFAAALAALAGGNARAETLTLQGAIELALAKNPNVAIAREKIEAQKAKVAGNSAHRGPSLAVQAAADLYREPYSLAFGSLGSFTLHERETTATTVMISQPLSGLAYLSELVGADEHETAAKRGDYDATRLETAYKTADAYIVVLEKRASADIAHRTVADIQSELDRALELRKADANTDIDVLRFRSAKAAADQTALRADTDAQNALSALILQIGLADGSAIDIADDLPPAPPQLGMTIDQAQHRALSARPELAAGRERLAAIDSSRTAARDRYLPDIRAVAAWNHLTGVQPFAPEDEEYVGLTAQWTVWDWGTVHDAVVGIEHDKQIASTAQASLENSMKIEVRTKWLDAKTTYDSLAVAETQQQTAEEAYRLQKVRYDNAAATTTDVLDAETEVARARLAFALARFSYYQALVALARSVGDLPAPGAGAH